MPVWEGYAADHPKHAVWRQGEAPPPLSPVVANGGALMEAHLRSGVPATPVLLSEAALRGGPEGGAASLAPASEAGSRAPSESGDLAAREGHKKGRFKVPRAPHTPSS